MIISMDPYCRESNMVMWLIFIFVYQI